MVSPSSLFRGHSHLEKLEKYEINYDAFQYIESYEGINEPVKTEE
ncbi:MAG: hypothetical protein ACI4V7_11140 [Succinivibrionaceae bacterium]